MSDHAELLAQLIAKIEEARLEERRRAARIVLEFEVYSPYVVQKQFLAERKAKLIELIMDGMK